MSTTFNEETKDQLFIKIKDLPIIEFDRNLLAEDVFEVDFGGSYKLQITNENGTFVITNAMNGYGNNCYEQFKGEKVSFLDYYDYALSIANQNANPTPSKGHKSAEQLYEKWKEFVEESRNSLAYLNPGSRPTALDIHKSYDDATFRFIEAYASQLHPVSKIEGLCVVLNDLEAIRDLIDKVISKL